MADNVDPATAGVKLYDIFNSHNQLSQSILTITWLRLHKIMDNEEFQSENIEESFASLGLALVTQEVPLVRPSSKFIDHQIIGIN